MATLLEISEVFVGMPQNDAEHLIIYLVCSVLYLLIILCILYIFVYVPKLIGQVKL